MLDKHMFAIVFTYLEYVIQYRTGPCNTMSYIVSNTIPDLFLSNIFMWLYYR